MLRLITIVGIWMLIPMTVRAIDVQLTDLVHDVGSEAASGNCPRQCSCLGNVIDCSEKSLKVLFHIPAWVENLELSSNRLGYEAVQSQVANLNKLQVLNLNHNNLGRIPTFRGLGNLFRLLLANNGIEVIEVEALQAVASLKFLDLSRNSIKDVQYGSFPAKTSLQYLNLNFNKLTSLTKGTFQRLPLLVPST